LRTVPLNRAIRPGTASVAIGIVAIMLFLIMPAVQPGLAGDAYSPGDGGLHSMVATALAGVVSLANRLSLQPARQRPRQAASPDVLPAPAGRTSPIVPYRLTRKSPQQAAASRAPALIAERGPVAIARCPR
jgi:hypothetical protein